jgi:phosphohistidine phosphatase
MLTLSLLRHAKSSWISPSLPDQDRPLNARGVADAPVMGRAMANYGIDPSLVLCSSARRTRDTLALVLPELKVEPRVIYDDALYHATASEMLRTLRGVSTDINSVMLVGHNPEIHALALDLIGKGLQSLKMRLLEKLPTTGFVVITFPFPSWDQVTVNSGELKLFLTPKILAGG